MKPMGPLKMDRNLAENWRKWRQRWIPYANARGANEKDEATQCAIFLHTIGEEALAVYDTFSFTGAEKDKIEPLIQKFQDYCSPKKNTTYEPLRVQHNRVFITKSYFETISYVVRGYARLYCEKLNQVDRQETNHSDVTLGHVMRR